MAKSKKQPQAEESLSRAELEAKHGPVWNTRQLAQSFTITSIIAPHVIVRRKADGAVGRLSFQNNPRYYHSFEPAAPSPEAA